MFAAAPLALWLWGGGNAEVPGPSAGPRRVVVSTGSATPEVAGPGMGPGMAVVTTGSVAFEPREGGSAGVAGPAVVAAELSVINGVSITPSDVAGVALRAAGNV
mmetsp:Transcript_27456/g.86519  ORF Transcript_27456/g.86519 Transcript_27456/m.86519 type:complete len:104 (-) Transcript_27456:195-506(-)